MIHLMPTLKFETFKEWGVGSILKSEDQIADMWPKVCQSEDLINHLLEFPIDNQNNILICLNMGFDPVIIGMFHRLGFEVHKTYPSQFRVQDLINIPGSIKFPTNASVEFRVLKGEIMDKLDSVRQSEKSISWRELEIQLAIFELQRVIHGEETILKVMNTCLTLDEVPKPDVIDRALHQEKDEGHPAEWLLLVQ